MNYKKQIWIDEVCAQNDYSGKYWNDCELDKKKVWGLWESDFSKLLSSFEKKGLLKQFDRVAHSTDLALGDKIVLSLGAGVCLLEGLIIKKYSNLEKVICVEFSKHRIFEIAPNILHKLNVDLDKVELCFGSFLDIKIPSASVDVVLVSQAFHHANNPELFLSEIQRVLVKNGKIIIVGEHWFSPKDMLNRGLKHVAKYILDYQGFRKKYGVIPSYSSMFPPDEIKGDRHYSLKTYNKYFSEAGLKFKHFVFEEFRNQAFLLEKLE